MRPLLHAVFAAAAALGCGAKTGLLVPDALSPPDAADVLDVPDAPEVDDVCRPAPLPIERFAAEVILVIDRSGSMTERTRTGLTRWQAVTTALSRVLPTVDRELLVGLTQYPGAITSDNQCGDNSRIELAPRLLNARNVQATLGRTTPTGGTPTFEALRAAQTWYRTNPPSGRVRGRYLLLATDGGPNCNSALNRATCACTNARTGCNLPRGELACLDDDRTISLLRELSGAGLATFVIGTPGDDAGSLPQTLDRMAIAGGRPRPGAATSRYYRAEDVDEFAAAFRSITTELVRCRYVTNPVDDLAQVSVTVGGREVPRDETRAEGWDWTSPSSGEIVLFGGACEASQRAGGEVSIRYGCQP